MKEVKKSTLRLNKKTVTILSNVQQMQVKGGEKAALASGSFHSMWGCDTISCCSIPFCSLYDCDQQSD
ncbi:hypothetical protein FAM09_23590 [Niastella caeni]|uniref:Uncharacterized protein n=1 Tax=Niastella caeni TaxID=2569763 RepID=A0A4S8HIW3_9BACT|nr:hypothetical protein [Niastella caeni]THU34975.1 hypothetical protein FAM09_23590 [Niastella caeni]